MQLGVERAYAEYIRLTPDEVHAYTEHILCKILYDNSIQGVGLTIQVADSYPFDPSTSKYLTILLLVYILQTSQDIILVLTCIFIGIEGSVELSNDLIDDVLRGQSKKGKGEKSLS